MEVASAAERSYQSSQRMDESERVGGMSQPPVEATWARGLVAILPPVPTLVILMIFPPTDASAPSPSCVELNSSFFNLTPWK